MTEFNTANIINDFEKLKKAFIDASSIIYLNKINLFDKLSKILKLYSIEKIINETGLKKLNLIIYDSNEFNETANDDLLLKCSIKKKTAIISDDKKILTAAGKNHLQYYNSIMMILFLFYKKAINKDACIFYINKLKNIARYSDNIYLKSEKLLNELLKTY